MISVQEYEPVDLGEWCIRGGAEVKMLIGWQTFHGLPFTIGPNKSDASRCFIGFGEGGAKDKVMVPLGSKAFHVVIAHRLLESNLPKVRTWDASLPHGSFVTPTARSGAWTCESVWRLASSPNRGATLPFWHSRT